MTTEQSTNTQGISRSPRAIVTINGTQVKWESLSITTNTFYVADKFSITLGKTGQPDGIDENFWASTQQCVVAIYLGFPKNVDSFTTADLELFITGDADGIIDDFCGKTINISGRDFSSRMIDKKITQKFSNQTASQIATMFANEHGLNPKVTTTSTPVGTYYEQQQVLLAHETTEWDLLTFLAQNENFVVFVQNYDLIFEPRPESTQNPYVFTYQPATENYSSPTFNGINLKFTRSLTLAKDVKVTIKVPYGSKNGKPFYRTKTASHTNSTRTGNLQKYSYVIPGLTPDQATQRADQILRDITRNEIIMETSCAPDNVLKKDSIIKVTGTGTVYDNLYYADEVVRNFSYDEGYIMNITAKNHAVDSEIIE